VSRDHETQPKKCAPVKQVKQDQAKGCDAVKTRWIERLFERGQWGGGGGDSTGVKIRRERHAISEHVITATGERAPVEALTAVREKDPVTGYP